MSIHDTKAKYQDGLLAKPGVVSVGIGKDPDGNLVVIVGLDRERPDTIQSLPSELEGHPVRTEVVGRIQAKD